MAKTPRRKGDDAAKFVEELLKDPEVRILYDQEHIKTRLAMAVKSVRQRAHMTQSQLAKKAGTTQGVIARLESGSDLRTPTMPLLARIATACGAEFDIGFRYPKAA